MSPLSKVTLRFRQSSFVRGTAVVAGGSAVAQALPIVLTPVLSRLYSPADLGVLALYVSYISLLAGASTLGYAQAIVSAQDDQEGADLAVLALLLVVPLAVVFSLLLWILRREAVLGFEQLPGLAIATMVLSLVLTEAFYTLRYWLIRKGDYATISRAMISQSAGRMGTQVLASFVHPSWGALVLGEIVGRSSSMRRMASIAWPGIRDHVSSPRTDRLREIASKFRKFPLFAVPSMMLDNLAVAIPVPLVASYFGLQAAGHYSIATRILMVPLVLIGASVADVFHNRVAVYAREEPSHAKPFMFKVAGGLLLLGLLPTFLVAQFAVRIVPFVLGEEWLVAGAIAATIAPWALAQLAVSPISRVVLVYQGQEIKLAYDIVNLASVIGIFLLAGKSDWTLLYTVRVLAWTQVGLYVLYFFILIRILDRDQRRSGDRI